MCCCQFQPVFFASTTEILMGTLDGVRIFFCTSKPHTRQISQIFIQFFHILKIQSNIVSRFRYKFSFAYLFRMRVGFSAFIWC